MHKNYQGCILIKYQIQDRILNGMSILNHQLYSDSKINFVNCNYKKKNINRNRANRKISTNLRDNQKTGKG